VKATLYVATSARDTDFTVKLVDVFPDGEARILTDGVLRLRYRKSLGRAELARPGEVYEIAVDAGVTANVFLRGHRIRVEISSSNFPKFDRNANTGGSIVDETRLLTANQTIYHGGTRASRVELMVLPPRILAQDVARPRD
jgi:putative CocE/NonD family hydrolase